jgi:hypothetical protein
LIIPHSLYEVRRWTFDPPHDRRINACPPQADSTFFLLIVPPSPFPITPSAPYALCPLPHALCPLPASCLPAEALKAKAGHLKPAFNSYPLHFHYLLGVFPPNGKGYDQCQSSHLFDYFGYLHVFLKTTGNPKGTIRNDPEFKRETHQTLDTGDLPH